MKSPHSQHNYHLNLGDKQRSSSISSSKTDSSKTASSEIQQVKDWGIKVTVDELYRLRKDALRLTASPADAVNSFFPGAYQAVFHGRGLEFDEVRAYQWGDDYRSIDWRVTARTGQMHTKLFHQEKERSLYLVLDCSPAMHFASRLQFKWVLAARSAAIFAWLASENSDRVGLVLFGHQSRCDIIAPGMGQASLLKVFKLLAQQEKPISADSGNTANSSMEDALNYLQHITETGTLILLLSDFNQLNKKSKRHLAYLCQHHDLAAIKLSDPLERNLPKKGRYAISNADQMMTFDSQQRGLQEAYRQKFEQSLQQQIELFQHYTVRLLHLSTAQTSLEQLRQTLRPKVSKRTVSQTPESKPSAIKLSMSEPQEIEKGGQGHA